MASLSILWGLCTSGLSALSRMCTSNMPLRSISVGKSQAICRSNLPGLSRALEDGEGGEETHNV